MSNLLTQPKAVVPAAFEQELIKLDQGLLKELPANASFTINGVALNPAAIDAMLQGWIASFKGVDTAKAQYQAALVQRLAITAVAKAFVKLLKPMIKAYFGPQSEKLVEFGINVDKAVETTSQQKTVTAAKRAQTRAVRGTMGKKQRAKKTVVGNPPVLVPSVGEQQIGPPPVNVGHLGPSVSLVATPTPTPSGSGSGSGNPTGSGSTPAPGQ